MLKRRLTVSCSIFDLSAIAATWEPKSNVFGLSRAGDFCCMLKSIRIVIHMVNWQLIGQILKKNLFHLISFDWNLPVSPVKNVCGDCVHHSDNLLETQQISETRSCLSSTWEAVACSHPKNGACLGCAICKQTPSSLRKSPGRWKGSQGP